MDKPKILIVEDDLDLSDMLNAYFRVQNYDVLTAAWGKEALEISQGQNLALIMLDIRLPDIDGYEVCRQMRLHHRTQSVPIIFLTEKRDRVDKLQGLELGVVDYITKPFDVQELRLRVRNAISRAARQTNTNPVTELPENELIEDKLNALLASDEKWALLLIAIMGISDFRERYGFVAADDVMRAIAMMVSNAVREYGNPDDMVGHLAPEDFLISTTSDKVAHIRERIENRILQSREFFYPLKDRETVHQNPELQVLHVKTGVVESGNYPDLDTIKQSLFAAAGMS